MRRKPIEITMQGVNEYCEGLPVCLLDCTQDQFTGKFIDRYVIQATNEGGHNSTEIDLVDLLFWLKKNKPDIIKNIFID